MIEGEKLQINDKVMVTSDEEERGWLTGELLSIEDDRYYTVGFHNPNSGDFWVNVYDSTDPETKFRLIERLVEE